MHNPQFLTEIESLPAQKKHQRRRSFFIGFIVVVMVVGVLAIWTAINAGLMATSLLDGRDRLLEAKDSVETLSFDQAKESLDQAEISFEKANKHLQRIGWLKVLPWLGPQVEASEQVLNVSSDLFKLVDQIADLGADVVRLVGEAKQSTGGTNEILPLRYDELSPETKRIVLQRINGAAPDLALAAEQAKMILVELQDMEDVPEPMGLVVRKLDGFLSDAYETLSLAATASRLIPAFTGLGDEKNFLILLENNSEMRPAGGFIGTYGILRIEDGEIRELTLKDSYLLDSAADPTYNATPPAPLQKYLSANKWYFRDSNWSPDFPVSARNAISMFTNEVLSIPVEARSNIQEPLSFDGVIAFTPTFVADLLKITGPIVVGDQTFSADNILDTLKYQVEKAFAENGIPYAQRKDIITSLLNETKTKIFDLSLAEWTPFFQALKNNLETKQMVLFSSFSIEAEEVIKKAGWGGVVEPGGGDFLMVVDANLASLKTDPQVERSISYSLEKSEAGRFIGKVNIHYNHLGGFDWKTTRYRTYTRIYVPRGSELIGGSGMLLDDKLKNPSGAVGVIDVGQELGATVFGAFISIEPGESRDLSFEYYLPAAVSDLVENGGYSLAVDKQSGTLGQALTLDLNFGKKVAGAEPAETQSAWGDKIYGLETVLDTDKEFFVWF